ncbi:Cytochrome P450, E-class, group I [Fusarium oxysporum f. sp. vasinfectum]|nr:Cytochrome P450, E-class, group I [Fusarium oxysporum f. sp. vasinfectum]
MPSATKRLSQKSKYFYNRGASIKHPDIVFTIDRESHRSQRRSLSHAFSARALREAEGTIQRHARLFAHQISQRGSPGTGGVDMSAAFTWLTFDIIGDLTFGESFGSVANWEPDTYVALILEFIKHLTIIQAAKRLGISEGILSFLIPGDLKDSMASLVVSSWATSTSAGDFFAHILRDGSFNRDHLAEQAKILLLDGSETTATFLAGVTYLLLKSPTALAKLQCEVRSSFASLDEIRGDSLNQLPYLRAVIEEGLRLFPPVPLGLPRTCPGAMIDGWYVPSGTEVSVDNFVMSHDEKFFPEPDEFRPERWLEGQTGNNKEASRPFSIGPRACLGVDLAYLEASLILATMVYSFDWELVDKSLHWFEEVELRSFWKKPQLFIRYHPRGSFHGV